jgi:hypothetical protein
MLECSVSTRRVWSATAAPESITCTPGPTTRSKTGRIAGKWVQPSDSTSIPFASNGSMLRRISPSTSGPSSLPASASVTSDWQPTGYTSTP